MNHSDLCVRAEKWLKSQGCGVTGKEVVSGCLQQPDAIGFKHWGYESLLVECKVSRADFMADRNKCHQAHPVFSVGTYRWYMTPEGLLNIKDLPEGWGLLEVKKDRVKIVKGSLARNKGKWDSEQKTIVITWQHPAGRAHRFKDKNRTGETAILFALLRKAQISVSETPIEGAAS